MRVDWVSRDTGERRTLEACQSSRRRSNPDNPLCKSAGEDELAWRFPPAYMRSAWTVGDFRGRPRSSLNLGDTRGEACAAHSVDFVRVQSIAKAGST